MKFLLSIFSLALLVWPAPSCTPADSPRHTSTEDNPKVELTANQETTQPDQQPLPGSQGAEPETRNPPSRKASADETENLYPAHKDERNLKPETSIPIAETEETRNQKPSPAPASNMSQPNNAPPNHQLWNALLQQYVSANGRVNYKGLVSDKAQLQAYLDELAAHPADKSWSREEQLAYWINAYNAFTVKLIVDHYPVSSIRDIHDGTPWDVQWIKLGGKILSLDNIENEIIRKQFQEPRIHFAVNCAANSCPPLLNKAWTAEKLEAYLSQQARSFINDPRFNKLNPKSVQLSKIFEWYAEDFGSIIPFLNKYAKTLIDANAKISYLEYDWGLNGE